ncbi:MAG: endonuclease/exonuclease/phosphatase, partial [Pseudomonadota bacterium]
MVRSAPSISGASSSRTITIDDGFRNQNPDLDELTNVTIDENGDGVYNTADEFGMGDTVDSLTGVVRFSNATNEFGNSGSNQTNYRILPTEEVTFTNDNPREEEAPEIEGADLTIASFNVLNYFTTLDQGSNTTITGQDPRGADNQTELDRQTEKLVTTILELDADILALNELENDFTLGDG